MSPQEWDDPLHDEPGSNGIPASQEHVGRCARCGKDRSLAPDGTCWSCAVEYRDEIIEEERALDVPASQETALRDGPWMQLSDAATPGPWAATTTPGFVTGHLTASGRNIADMRYRNGHADAALIVAAVNYIRAALAPKEAKDE